MNSESSQKASADDEDDADQTQELATLFQPANTKFKSKSPNKFADADDNRSSSSKNIEKAMLIPDASLQDMDILSPPFINSGFNSHRQSSRTLVDNDGGPTGLERSIEEDPAQMRILIGLRELSAELQKQDHSSPNIYHKKKQRRSPNSKLSKGAKTVMNPVVEEGPQPQ